MESATACVVAGDAHPLLARRVANAAGLALLPRTVERFADGETRVRIEGEVEGRQVFVVQPTSPPVNERLMALALLADAARASGASRLIAVIPYFGYARQDARKRTGEARSAQLAARILECAGFDRVIVLEPHSQGLENAFRIAYTPLEADDAVLPLLRKWRLRDLTVVSPDAGGVKRAQRYAAALGAPLAVVAKTRPRADAAVAYTLLGEVRGRQCLIVDDMASTGGTIATAAQALRAAGARAVHAFFVHAVMAPGAFERIKKAGVRLVGATDSVPREGKTPRSLKIVGVASLLARALRER
jgi:ribose-phosphate pyrophosphokinase